MVLGNPKGSANAETVSAGVPPPRSGPGWADRSVPLRLSCHV